MRPLDPRSLTRILLTLAFGFFLFLGVIWGRVTAPHPTDTALVCHIQRQKIFCVSGPYKTGTSPFITPESAKPTQPKREL